MDRNDRMWQMISAVKSTVTDPAWIASYKELLRQPVNPCISDEAREMLELLYSVQGKRMLTGQHEYLEDPYNYGGQIYNKTGKRPMLKGFEFGGISGQGEAVLAGQRDEVVAAAKAWHDAGGMVTATYHQVYPGTALTWPNVQRSTTQAEFDQILTPGTVLHTAFLAAIDEVAVYLKHLRDYKVPVLWRPYHEMNGDWFWWGEKTNFNALWELMYQRYTRYHGLNNLLWVWSANANNEWTKPARDYYVGHNRADALGFDIYDNAYYYSNYDELVYLAEGKIISVTENGQLPDMTRTSLRQFKLSWFMTWGSYLTDKNTDAVIQTVYNHPFALNRGDSFTPVVVPPASAADGILGNYYFGQNFNTLKVTKVVPTVNFNWTSSTTINSWNMTVRWTGFVQGVHDEEYTFYVQSSDGVRLWIDNILIIDDWTVHGTLEVSGTAVLAAGKQHRIKLEYFNNQDTLANVKLSWESASTLKEVIPQTQLYSV
ncbi:glycosyl hydrolase [Paenibacillus typhae]|uniref:glycosyl hydrolase n=1 Tax=Paenibacillus typhae TaxID=1174501 RepID=UPI001C8DFE22|nr:glycosyl hydrolase [Paenibacillus typhae]MBY0009778.1 glycosyl hydrolase [Paenibacillus typhae]